VKSASDWPKPARGVARSDPVLRIRPAASPGESDAEESPTYESPKKTGSNANIQPPAVPTKLPEGTVEQKWMLSTGPEGKIKIPVILTVPPGKGRSRSSLKAISAGAR